MENELKSNFDIIVLGTGFVESLVAAAAARIGKKVLHVDSNGFYGGQWASFSLSSLQEWVDGVNSDSTQPTGASSTNLLSEGEALSALTLPYSLYRGVKSQWLVQENIETAPSECDTAGVDTKEEDSAEGSKDTSSETKKSVVWSKVELEKFNRKFNIDLAPKILFARGALVELLISSNVARYVEFKCISRVLTWVEEESDSASEGKLLSVPCNRSDIFTTDVIGLIEKRLLMKFLQFCYTHDQNKEEWADYAEKSFKEFLESRSLTPKLIHFITSAIGMVEEDVNCVEGLRKTSLFLNSLGRYGSLPFLFTLYGSGEMPQAFCRLCAVFEGVYILRRSVEYMIVKDGTFVGIASEGEKFLGENLVMDSGYAPSSFKSKAKRKQSVSRGVFITDRSVSQDEKEQLTILRMPFSDRTHTAVTVIELGSGCAVCPKDAYLVHLVCGGEDAEKDLKPTAERLFHFGEEASPQKPKVLYSLYFNQTNLDFENGDSDIPSNVYLCGGPDAALDYDEAIQQAKTIFWKIFPDGEFLPRAPDHNEIRFDESGTKAEGGTEMIREVDEEERNEALKALENEIKELDLAQGEGNV